MTNSIPFGKKVAAAALAALTLGAGLTMTTGEAEARNGRKGALIAAGVLGALAVGAIAAQAGQGHGGQYGHAGYDPEDAYVPAPVYHQQPVQYHQGYGHPGYGWGGHPGYRQHRRHRHHGYAETGFGYRGPVCTIRKQRVWTGHGWAFQRVQVCH